MGRISQGNAFSSGNSMGYCKLAFLGEVLSIGSKISASAGSSKPNTRYNVSRRRLGQQPTVADRQKVTGLSSTMRATKLTTTWARSCSTENGYLALKAVILKVVATVVENDTCVYAREEPSLFARRTSRIVNRALSGTSKGNNHRR